MIISQLKICETRSEGLEIVHLRSQITQTFFIGYLLHSQLSGRHNRYVCYLGRGDIESIKRSEVEPLLVFDDIRGTIGNSGEITQVPSALHSYSPNSSSGKVILAISVLLFRYSLFFSH